MTKEEITQALKEALNNDKLWLESIKAQLVAIDGIYKEFLKFNGEFEIIDEIFKNTQSIKIEIETKIQEAQEILKALPELKEAASKIKEVKDALSAIEMIRSEIQNKSEELEGLIEAAKRELQEKADELKVGLDNKKDEVILEADKKINDINALKQDVQNISDAAALIKNECQSTRDETREILKEAKRIVDGIDDKKFILFFNQKLCELQDLTRKISLNQLKQDIPAATPQNIGGFRAGVKNGDIALRVDGSAYVVGYEKLQGGNTLSLKKIEELKNTQNDIKSSLEDLTNKASGLDTINELKSKDNELEELINSNYRDLSSKKANHNSVILKTSSSNQTISSPVTILGFGGDMGTMKLGVNDISRDPLYMTFYSGNTRIAYVGFAGRGASDFTFSNGRSGAFVFDSVLKYNFSPNLNGDWQLTHKGYVDSEIRKLVSRIEALENRRA